MRLLRKLDARSAASGGYVAAIGGFDGIHLGHRALISRACELSRNAGQASMVLSFEPLPKEYFAAGTAPGRLTNFRERWRLLEALGVDLLCLLRFNEALRNLDGVQFARLLVEGGVRTLVVGHDFRAGYRGEATASWFEREGPGLGLAVEVLPPVVGGGSRIGSRAIRDALSAGDLDLAARLLGRPYSMRGKVISGERLGRTLGFPTANLRLGRRRTPLDGIFAVRVRGIEPGRALGGVASLGTRPTVGGTVPLLEAHVFDYDGNLYGRELEVEFVARLRDELRFDTLDAMVAQMHRDAAGARARLAMA
ncbi:MAG TPA: bifunctional riboflavin kinase/FAD synthetase [Steroidobacteraceae bacterium]|nr:bifunctional riboflavin kinase/FAD synthetase [Steroidobacteraceae bacterium]